jgi:hypothetical protein
VTFVSQWFASLWVVAEGYSELGIQDNFIQSILRNPPGHADLLRRCRNGVYHFQPDLLAPRLAAFLSATQSALAWAHALHSELIRLFWQYPERAGLSDVQATEWRAAAHDILGWLPDDSPYVTITQLEQRIRDYIAVVPEADHSPAADDVRASIDHLRSAIAELRSNLLRDQQRYRDAGWLDAYS